MGLFLLTITSNNSLIECLLTIAVTLRSVCVVFSVPKGGVFPLGNKSWFYEPDSRSLVVPHVAELTGRKWHYCAGQHD